MTAKGIHLKKISRERYIFYWDKAMEFFEAMVDASQKKNWNATGLAGVHCCISATDALLVNPVREPCSLTKVDGGIKPPSIMKPLHPPDGTSGGHSLTG